MTKYTIHRQDGNAGLDGYFEVRADGKVVFEAIECDCRDYVREHRSAERFADFLNRAAPIRGQIAG